MKPVGAPLPCIAGNAVQSEPIRWEGAGRAWRSETVLTCVAGGKLTLPDIAEMPSVRRQLIAPRIELLLETAARRIFPLRFSGQPLARPCAVSGRVVPGDMHDGVIVSISDRCVRSLGMTPVRAVH